MPPPVYPRPAVIKCRIVWSVIGVIVGVSIFTTFGFHFNNWHCASWGLASGLFAALALCVHVEYYKYEWSRRPKLLAVGMVVGCLSFLASISAFVVYLILAVTERQNLTPWNDGYYLACVWSAMTGKWTCLFLYYCFVYRRIVLSSDVINETPGRGSYQRI